MELVTAFSPEFSGTGFVVSHIADGCAIGKNQFREADRFVVRPLVSSGAPADCPDAYRRPSTRTAVPFRKAQQKRATRTARRPCADGHDRISTPSAGSGEKPRCPWK